MKTDEQKNEIQKEVKRLSKWFKIEFTLSVFGQVLIHWIYPAKEEE